MTVVACTQDGRAVQGVRAFVHTPPVDGVFTRRGDAIDYRPRDPFGRAQMAVDPFHTLNGGGDYSAFVITEDDGTRITFTGFVEHIEYSQAAGWVASVHLHSNPLFLRDGAGEVSL